MIDRALQHDLLIKMRDAFPNYVLFPYKTEEEKRRFAANLAYLGQHGLCEFNMLRGMGGDYDFGSTIITAKGIDFLADDGGLSAILGVVTVKLHVDTIRELLEEKIAKSDLPEAEKSAFRKHLASLPGTALQAGMTELVKMGIAHLANPLHWLQTLGSHVGLPGE